MEKVDNRLEQLAVEHQTMRSLLQCPVCLEMLMNPARTKCGHMFCRACIEDWVGKRSKRGRVACPSCQVQGVTKRSLEIDPIMAELVVEVRRLLHAEKEDTRGDVNFLDIRVMKEGARESAETLSKPRQGERGDEDISVSGSGGTVDLLDMICGESEESWEFGGRRGVKRKGGDGLEKNEGSRNGEAGGRSAINHNIKSDETKGEEVNADKESSDNSFERQGRVGGVVAGGSSLSPGVSNPGNGKRRLARKKREPLVVSTIRQAWNKEKGKQRKTYSKAPSTPSTENISVLGSQVLPGEELSGDEDYWQERRERNLPKVSSVSKVDKVGRWLGDTTSGEYMDLGSQPNQSQSSVSTPTNRTFLPPRELPDVSPLDRGLARIVPLPLSPLDTNILDQSNPTGVKSKIKKQNQLWDKMTGSKNLTPSPAMLETSSLSSSPTMSQLMPNSCQVDINDTFDKLIPQKKPPPPQPPKSAPAPSSPALFCSQMSSLDDSLPMLLSPGVSLNIIKSLESDSGEEITKEKGKKQVEDASVSGVKSVSLSDLLADEEPGERKGRGKKVSWGDIAESKKGRNIGKEKKSPGWSKVGLAIGEMAATVPKVGGKYPALNISNVPGENEKNEEEMEIEPVDSIELEDARNEPAKEAPPGGETETDSFPSVISASICSGEEKSYKVISALCGVSPGRHGGWGTQEAGKGKERVEKVGRLVALEEEGLASHEAEIARIDSGSSGGRRASFQLDVSTCELERVSLPQDTEEMVASMGEVDKQGTKATISTKKKRRLPAGSKQSLSSTTSKDKLGDGVSPVLSPVPVVTPDPTMFTRPAPKLSTTKGMKVSFSLVGRVRSSISLPKREKVVSFLQLGRLATQATTTASLPSLRDILAKTSSYASDIGDPDRTPQPRQSVAQWLRNLHTPDSIESAGTPVLANRGRRAIENCVDMEVQTSQSLGVKNVSVKEGSEERKDDVGVEDHHFDGEEMEEVEDQDEEDVLEDHEENSCDSSYPPNEQISQLKEANSQQDKNVENVFEHPEVENNIEQSKEPEESSTHLQDSSPPPTLSTLLQSHLSNISPPPPLSAKPNARLARKKAKCGPGNPYLDPKPGTSGTQKKQTRAQARNAKKPTRSNSNVDQLTNEVPESLPEVSENTVDKIVDADKYVKNVVENDNTSQVESSCPESGDPWVINLSEDSSELPDIDNYAGEGGHQPFMAEILGREMMGLCSQDKETREEELDRVAMIQFEQENCRMEDSPVRKRGRMDDTDEDSPAKVVKKKVRRIESDDEDTSQEVEMIPSGKNLSTRSSVRRTPGGTAFQNTFQPEEKIYKPDNTGSQVIEVIDSQEEMVMDQNGYTDQDMELPVLEQQVSQVTQSKSLLDSPSIPACSLSRSSSASSLTSDSEPDQRTTQEIKRDLALAEVRASKLRSDMDINVEVLGSQAFFQEMTSNRQVVDTTMSTIHETESMGLNVAREFVETEPLEHEVSRQVDKGGNESKTIIPETEAILESELFAGETEPIVKETEPVMDDSEPDNNHENDAIKHSVTDTMEAFKNAAVPDSDDDLFSQTPEDPKPKPSGTVEVLSPVVEAPEGETSQVIKSTSRLVSVDTSDWKFVTSNLVPSARKVVPQFIASLECKGVVGKVDDTVTHIIVSTGEGLEAQRTLKYLQGVASGVMVVSHLWAEACMVDRNNVARADRWEVTDEELGGANGPWRARKRKEERREPLLAGFEVLIEGQLEGLERSSVEDLLYRSGARAVPDKNAFSFTSGVTRLVLVDSTAVIGAKVVGKLLRSYRLAMLDKDWLLDTLGGHCVRPILHYTLDTVQREELVRAGYSGALVE